MLLKNTMCKTYSGWHLKCSQLACFYGQI